MSCASPSTVGLCSPVPAGVKPTVPSQCQAAAVSTCGLDGTCDGTGKCQAFQLGTVCKPGQCDGDTVSGTYRCDGVGRCVLGAVAICAPFSCDRRTNQCFPTCNSNANCISGRSCVSGSCGPKMTGATCTADGECASGHCADGLCCNTDCVGACRACNLVNLEGTCSPIQKGKTDVACANQDRSTCGTTGECDGFGTCVRYPPNATCQPASCASSTTVNSARTCDGLGTCGVSAIQSCGTYRCADGACKSPCVLDSDCADGYACKDGSCGVKMDGQTCTADVQCQNGHCVDGVCCNQACTGPCRSCSLPGPTLGRCTMTPAGTVDPRKSCVDMSSASCGTDGKCDGAGACSSYPPTSTTCGQESCTNDVYSMAPICNASHQCDRPVTVPCSPYHCNVAKCFTSCSGDAQCIPPYSCVNGACGKKLPPAACSADAECSTGHCSRGICCDTACNGVCETCGLPNLAAGTCTAVPSGASDPSGMCATTTTCGFNGLCTGNNTGLIGTQRCQFPNATTGCRNQSCTNGLVTAAATCDGAGTCPALTVTACGGGVYTCLDTMQCRTDCRDHGDADCIGVTCNTILKTCGEKLPPGRACGVDGDCSTAHCVDGFCCNTACAGACQACNNPGTIGTCSNVADSTAEPMCGPAAPPCGNTGLCAAGVCQKAAATVKCGLAVCSAANQFVAQPSCTGTGLCGSPPAPLSCGNFQCSTTAGCPATCASDAGCIPGTQCSLPAGTCVVTAAAGAAGVVGNPGAAARTGTSANSGVAGAGRM
jgi:hypothetical protein